MSKTRLYTIGFTKINAKTFFSKLKKAGVSRIIDVRINNVSQLAGFTKQDDLIYFLRELNNCGYLHKPEFAPTKEILNEYRKKQIDWSEYERQFKKLITDRGIEKKISPIELNNACLLCSEATAEKCHRRLVAEYLEEKLQHIEIVHL
jgi:uncharacterized protein (DUF488 family)